MTKKEEPIVLNFILPTKEEFSIQMTPLDYRLLIREALAKNLSLPDLIVEIITEYTDKKAKEIKAK